MFPDDNFLNNFAHRNNKVQRCTGEVSKARSIISPESLGSWQADTEGYLVHSSSKLETYEVQICHSATH